MATPFSRLRAFVSWWLGFLSMVAACDSGGPDGLARAKHQGGPRVVWDLFAKPIPEIPIPNDIATRIDPSSPTGRRVMLSLSATTRIERRIRSEANSLSGFSTIGNIAVSFDRPLDLPPFIQRHWPPNRDYSDDLVYLINVTPGSNRRGERIPLDFGQGNFPVIIDADQGVKGGDSPFGLFENDVHRTSNNFFFETVDEDVNCNGALDPGEDRDFDGVLDKPNILKDPILPRCNAEGRRPASEGEMYTEGCYIVSYESENNACVPKCHSEDCLITFYERETNTLIFRPLLALEQAAVYAVVLTTDMTGEDGVPIESPFPFINHTQQTPDLKGLRELIESGRIDGLASTDEIAFAWTFTTQAVTHEMEAIRQGLYGHGPFRWLDREYPAEVHVERIYSEESTRDNPYIFAGREMIDLLAGAGPVLAAGFIGDRQDILDEIIKSLEFTDYAMAGYVRTPYFLTDKNGIAEPSDSPRLNSMYPADDDESFDIDASTGRATVGENLVTFLCFVPKTTSAHKPPFPVGLHSHGTSLTRVEAFGFAGAYNRAGIAYCGVDGVGHGQAPPDPKDERTFRALVGAFGLEPFLDNVLFKGRARDLNNDGRADSGGDFWTIDLFHTRDVVRQTAIDFMQVIRMMRGWDGTKTMDMDGDGVPETLAGDFNMDGVPDFGGPVQPEKNLGKYYMDGCSLGGIVTAFTLGHEPALVAGAANSAAAGLTDTAVRTVQVGVVEAVYLPLFGQIVTGIPVAGQAGSTEIRSLALNVHALETVPMVRTSEILPGMRVELHNEINKEWDWAVADESGRFRLTVAADAINAVEKRHKLDLLGFGKPPDVVPVLSDDQTTLLGDALEIRLCSTTDLAAAYDPAAPCEGFTAIRNTTEEFTFQGSTFAAGSRLVALSKGFGNKRNTPRLRRFHSIAQTAIEAGDPASVSPHYFKYPLDFSYDTDAFPVSPQKVLVIPTVGDMNVPISTGIHLARTAGIIDIGDPQFRVSDRRFSYDGRSDLTENDVILDHFVAEGVERLNRFASAPWNDMRKILFDLDDLDDGLDCWKPSGGACAKGETPTGNTPLDAPDLRDRNLKPLRATVQLSDVRPEYSGVSGMRIPYTKDDGMHCFLPTEPRRPFNMDNFIVQQIVHFMATDGGEILDDTCLADTSCE